VWFVLVLMVEHFSPTRSATLFEPILVNVNSPVNLLVGDEIPTD